MPMRTKHSGPSRMHQGVAPDQQASNQDSKFPGPSGNLEQIAAIVKDNTTKTTAIISRSELSVAVKWTSHSVLQLYCTSTVQYGTAVQSSILTTSYTFCPPTCTINIWSRCGISGIIGNTCHDDVYVNVTRKHINR